MSTQDPDQQPAFDKVGEDFISHYDMVRGYVRQEVTRANLGGYIQGGGLRALDVGGGDGRDAEWLARTGGNTVHLIDPSEEMVSRASDRIQAAALSTLVTIDRGDPARLLAEDHGKYDVVLSHGVLMYLDDPVAHLRLLHDVVKPGGIISILTKGKDGFIQRLVGEGKIDEALTLQETDRMVNRLGQDVHAVGKKTMQTMLSGAGLHLLDWYGVRIVADADKRNITEVPDRQLEQIVRLETKLSRKKSVKGMGQMLQFICSKEES